MTKTMEVIGNGGVNGAGSKEESGRDDDLEQREKESVKTDSADVASKDWRKLFKANPVQTLQFFPPEVSNGTVVVSPPSEIFDEGELCWKNAVVAQFIGRIPNFSLFQRMVNQLWGDEGEVEVRPAGRNLFIIQLPSSEARDRVLEMGPWHIQNNPLIVRRWEPGMKSLDLNMARLLIWIQLGNVPLELFTKNGLSYIASAIGNPLYMDRFTANQSRLSFAKICVEVDVSSVIPKSIDVKMRNGSFISISVDVPWLPQKCTKCQVFGHNDQHCSKNLSATMAKVWIPKKKNYGDIIESSTVDEGIRETERPA